MTTPAPRNPKAVRRMFDAVAWRYDLMNRLMTFGQVGRWHRLTAQLAGLERGGRALDCATGSGEIALALARIVGPGGEITGLDFTPSMLEIARAKAARRGLEIDWQAGDVLALPYESGHFDAATIGFGVRNLADPAGGLGEMARVVRAGGRVVVLETGLMKTRWLRGLQRWYMARIVPAVGRLVLGDAGPYRDLDLTTSRFPSGDEFLAMMRGTGALSEVRAHPLAGGAAYIYVGMVA
jgi:demethylmenaquinone methyltransferase/2-methoxy-6-polyprenyl-1,4-benzoquinol methylase